MAASTVFLFRTRSSFVLLSCLIILILAGSTAGQPTTHSNDVVGVTPDQSRDPSLAEAEDARVQTVLIALGVPSVAQTETRPRPHGRLNIIPGTDRRDLSETRAFDFKEPFHRELRFPVSERFEIPRSIDPYWRPLPAPKRFRTEDLRTEGDDSQNGTSNKFHWKPAVLQSLLIQSVQHVYAIAVQERMRRELKGPFFKDWFRSVSNIHGWDDGNRFFTNYIAHPMQGAMTGFIFVQNHDRLKRQKFGESKTYWIDRLKAMAWSAAWSTQWEIGPFSQASIGNVGLKKGMAFVDIVVTPTIGTAWLIVEEAFDRYIIRHLEKRTNFVVKMFLRTLLNPMRGVANTLRFKEPWNRDRPFGS